MLRAKGRFENGEFSGLWRWNRANGKPLQVGRFVNNKRSGVWKRFLSTGALYDVGKYLDGERTGLRKIHDARGKRVREKRY